jgi:hypothetical protein
MRLREVEGVEEVEEVEEVEVPIYTTRSSDIGWKIIK